MQEWVVQQLEHGILRDSGLTEVHYFSLARIHKALVDMGADAELTNTVLQALLNCAFKAEGVPPIPGRHPLHRSR